MKQLKVSKSKVNIKVLENEDKRSFFSILAPRVVKVEMTLKEDAVEKQNREVKPKKEIELTEQEQQKAYENMDKFFKEFLTFLPEDTKYDIKKTKTGLNVDINHQNLGYLIGYKAKREKTLKELADKVARTVIKTRKSVTLEPMQAYERKIIHSRLQENHKVETISVGEEPARRIVVSLKNK